MEQRVKAELALPRTKIDLSRGAIPGYRGHVPRAKFSNIGRQNWANKYENFVKYDTGLVNLMAPCRPW